MSSTPEYGPIVASTLRTALDAAREQTCDSGALTRAVLLPLGFPERLVGQCSVFSGAISQNGQRVDVMRITYMGQRDGGRTDLYAGNGILEVVDGAPAATRALHALVARIIERNPALRVLDVRYVVADDGEGGSAPQYAETDAQGAPVPHSETLHTFGPTEIADGETVATWAAKILRDAGTTENVGSWWADPDGTGEQSEMSAHPYAIEPRDVETIDALISADPAILDAATHGFVRAMLWSCAEPLPEPRSTPRAADGSTLERWEPIARHIAEQLRSGADAHDLRHSYPDHFDDPETGGLENREPTDELTNTARGIVARFLAAADRADIDAHAETFGDPDGGHPGEYIGHTFYLSTAGSGVDFTDRAWKDDDPMTAVCERLTEVAKSFGEVEHLSAFELADGRVGL